MLLGENVYHWHSKVMLKLTRESGAWEWHQDYGYWHNDGCPYPRMVSAMIAIDRADEENGCLRVLTGPITWVDWITGRSVIRKVR